MILTCERCETRFRLDESRLPAKGARVRCSRCKHSFFVRAPGVTPAEAIDAVAAEAAHTAKPATADVSWDLDESGDPGATMQRSRPAAKVEASGDLVEDESEWHFEDEVPELGDSGASLDLPNGEAPALAAEPDPNESSFAQLGDPESWDLLSSSDSGSQPPNAPKPIGGLEVPVARAPAAPIEPAVQVAPPAPAHAEVRVESLPILIAAPAGRFGASGWAATVAFAALVLAGGLRGPTATAPASADVGRLAVENLRVRVVDNVWAGPTWVISGELHNPTADAQRLDVALGVVLLDGNGAPIEGAVAFAQPALDASTLQGDEPASLHERAEFGAGAFAARPLGPDTRVRFDAVFRASPRDAARFALDPQRLPPPPSRSAPPAPAIESLPPLS